MDGSASEEFAGADVLLATRTSIRTNRSSSPRILYATGDADSSPNGTMYAYFNAGWARDQLLTSATTTYLSLALDDSGRARFSYCEGASLRYFNYDTLR
jgi:hypothetical protein